MITAAARAVTITKHRNAYETLGVAKDADAATVKRAYRRKASKLHPDKPTGDKEAFQELNRAHKLLADPATRAKYDQYGDDAESVKTLREQAEAQLAVMVCQCVAQCGPDVAVVQKLRDMVDRCKDQAQQAVGMAKDQALKFRKAARRLKHKKGECVLTQALVHSAEQAEQQAKAAQFDVDKHAEMQQVLAEHEYDWSPPPQPSTWGVMPSGILYGITITQK